MEQSIGILQPLPLEYSTPNDVSSIPFLLWDLMVLVPPTVRRPRSCMLLCFYCTEDGSRGSSFMLLLLPPPPLSIYPHTHRHTQTHTDTPIMAGQSGSVIALLCSCSALLCTARPLREAFWFPFVCVVECRCAVLCPVCVLYSYIFQKSLAGLVPDTTRTAAGRFFLRFAPLCAFFFVLDARHRPVHLCCPCLTRVVVLHLSLSLLYSTLVRGCVALRSSTSRLAALPCRSQRPACQGGRPEEVGRQGEQSAADNRRGKKTDKRTAELVREKDLSEYSRLLPTEARAGKTDRRTDGRNTPWESQPTERERPFRFSMNQARYSISLRNKRNPQNDKKPAGAPCRPTGTKCTR